MIVKTGAVILRSISYRDHSRICWLYTRDYGRISVIIKGVRHPKHRLRGLFNAGNLLDIVYYQRAGRDIQILSDAVLLAHPLQEQSDLERFAVLYRILELVRHATEFDDANPALFRLLSSTLRVLYSSGCCHTLLHLRFLLHFIALLGFKPELNQCVLTGSSLHVPGSTGEPPQLSFLMNPGGLALSADAQRHAGAQQLLSTEQVCILQHLALADMEACSAIPAAGADILQLVELLQAYSAHHIDCHRSRKHEAIVSQILH